ncbi:neuralized-like protein 4 isoform X3 [Acanthaster planci]|uniref:Neuralized-like protein 4 isoform X3 n=1 Tax=Acanthaster planci TaxID=133434 RepID=A0A8B7Z6Q2_ACAPL|nr:neuralized-like protein 4 isoform X3 [Acanthaster planci]
MKPPKNFPIIDVIQNNDNFTLENGDSSLNMATTMKRRFHQRHGNLISLSSNGRTASRNEPRQEFNNGLVISKSVLKENEIFEVRIDKKVETWSGSIEVGVTSLDPGNLEFPTSATGLCEGAWILSGSTVLHDGEAILDEYACDLDSCNVGDRIGIQRTNSGELHLFHNGVDKGVAATGLPARVYAVVDLYGKCTQVTLLNTAHGVNHSSDDSSSEDDSSVSEDNVDDEDTETEDIDRVEELRVPLDNASISLPSNNALLFHQRHGSLITLLNNGRTAERGNAREEFNNGVVMTNRLLRSNELFEIRIDKLIDKWSGSIEIGVTTHIPESLDFPSTMTNLRTGTIMMSGCGILTNGKGTTREYGEFDLDDLAEGDRIGVMRKANGDLHFFINGHDQGRAVSNAPQDIFGVVDLYGMAVRVTILEWVPPATHAMTSFVDQRVSQLSYLQSLAQQESPNVFQAGSWEWTDRPRFHETCGIHAQVINGGLTAHRPNAMDDFNNAVVLTSRPLQNDEMFEIRIDRIVDKWAGSIEIGLTKHSPEELDFPSTMTNVRSGTWMMTGDGIMHNGVAIVDEYGLNLDRLREGDRIGVMRKLNGDLHFFIKGVDQGIAATNVPPNLFAVVDLYGQATQATIVEPGDYAEEPVEAQVPADDNILRFYHLHGRNVKISNNGLRAQRPSATGEFNDAIIMSNRPLRVGEMFEITIEKMVDRWSGSIEAGVTTIAPEELDFPSTMTDLDHDTWMLSGACVMKDGLMLNNSYGLDLDTVHEGDRIGIRSWEETLHFFLNGRDMGTACTNVPSDVYAVIDLYGQCAQVSLVPSSTPNNVLVTSRQDSHNSVITVPGLMHKFHTVCGSSIQLTEDFASACRIRTFDNAIVFSDKALRTDELFEVKVDKVASQWSGTLLIGLTTLNPDDITDGQVALPITAASLRSKDTWVIQGSQVKHNGKIIKDNFSSTLERLGVGDTVGVKRCPDGTMHVFLNGDDLGTAARDIPKSTHAVVDVYGVVEAVSVTSSSTTSLESQRAPSISSSSGEDSDREQGEPTCSNPNRIHFHKHGKNICLSDSNLRARRTASYNQAVVISEYPLPRKKLFEIKLEKVTDEWTSSVKIGVTNQSPERLGFPASASNIKKGTWIVQGDAVFHNSNKVRTFNGPNLDQLKEGDTLGVLVDAQGQLHLYVYGRDHGVIAEHIPNPCYPLVDLYGQCKEVSIVTEELGAIGVQEEREKAAFENGLKENTPQSLYALGGSGRICEYQKLCLRFKITLGLHDAHFETNPKFNKCYCEPCRKYQGTSEYGDQGDPLQRYTRPFGWCKFAIKLHSRAETLNVFDLWHVAFHGTKAGAVRKILDSGTLLLPGDIALGGDQLTEQPGHFNDSHKPKDFDTKQIFISPSMNYAGCNVYAKKQKFTDPKTKQVYNASVAFQVRVRPNSYTTGPQTIGVNHNIDPYIENSKIEWFTKERSAIVPYALLVRVQPK